MALNAIIFGLLVGTVFVLALSLRDAWKAIAALKGDVADLKADALQAEVLRDSAKGDC